MSDTLDVLTLQEARVICGKGSLDTVQDDTIVALVTTASRTLDMCVGPVVKRSVTSETVQPHGSYLELSMGPVTAVSTVTENGTTLTSSEWYAEPYRPNPTLLSGVVVRRAGDYPTSWVCGLGLVKVGYLAGRFASTTTVEARYKQAAALILKNLWRTYESNVGGVDDYDVPHQSFPTYGVPQAVRQLLAEEWQDTAGFGA